jgi:hypothetical protein
MKYFDLIVLRKCIGTTPQRRRSIEAGKGHPVSGGIGRRDGEAPVPRGPLLRVPVLLWLILTAFQPSISTVHAAPVVFTYQGRVTVAGTNFTGLGEFEFALVISTNSSLQATATANMGGISPNEFVSSCTVNNPGNGYTGSVPVTFSGGGGSGASAVANVSAGIVTGITVLTPGSSYSSAPAAMVAAPPPDISYTTYWSNDGTSVNGSEPASAVGISVSDGLFMVVLGDTTQANMAAIDSSLFAQPNLELRIWFNDGAHGFSALSPTQKLTPAPYAIDSGSASNLLGTLSASQLTGTLPASVLGGTYSGSLSFTNGSNSFSGTFNGNGAGVTNVSANSLAFYSTNVSITSWGWNAYGQRNIPPNLNSVVGLAVGYGHSLAVNADGSVVAWGAGETNNPSDNIDFGQAIVPAGLSNVQAVAAGYLHSLALRKNGTVVAWGAGTTNNPGDSYDFGQSIVPANLTNATAVSAGAFHGLALKADGTIMAWGAGTTNNPGDGHDFGQSIVPPGLNSVMAVSAAYIFSVALRSNGTVIAWGDNQFGETNIPAGLSNVVSIAAGAVHTLALKANGTVVAWGAGETNNPTDGIDFGQSIVPAGLSNVVAISAGFVHSLALKADGTVVAWGDDSEGATNVPVGLSGVLALAPGCMAQHALAVRKKSDSQVAWLNSDNTFNGNITVNGDTTVSGEMSAADLRLDDGTLWLRSGNDQNNALGWYGPGKTFGNFGSVNGPILFGNFGGGLGSMGTNGQQVALAWDNLQHVGIGTTTPGARLDLGGDNANSKLVVGGYGGFSLGVNGSQFMFNLGGDGGRFSFMDAPGGNELVSIEGFSGYSYVGIGTPSPTSALDVHGEVALGTSGQYYAPGAPEVLLIIRGVVRFDGVILAGTGFSVVHTGTGAYTLTFSPSFSDMPAVVVSVQHGVAQMATTSSVSSTTAFVGTWNASGAASDQYFHFIAMGPQ